MPWLASVNLIPGATIPVIKLECTPEMANTKIDITVQNARHKGLECVEIVKQYLKQYSQLEPLVLIFKYILKYAGLSDPYKVRFIKLIN